MLFYPLQTESESEAEVQSLYVTAKALVAKFYTGEDT